jgi:hypothetical protein
MTGVSRLDSWDSLLSSLVTPLCKTDCIRRDSNPQKKWDEDHNLYLAFDADEASTQADYLRAKHTRP